MKNIIHIFGPSGAGTSTLGRKICRELGYTFYRQDSSDMKSYTRLLWKALAQRGVS